VAKDNTVAMGERRWQLEKARFRPTLAGSTVTIHEHLNHTISIRFGPHVVGRFAPDGTALTRTESAVEKTEPRTPWKTRRREIPTFPPRRRLRRLNRKRRKRRQLNRTDRL
jgi:hypothetical protein